jgi:inosine-uridine nucleoside N-ribohydrolase
MLEEEYPRCINLGTVFKDLDSYPLDEKMNSLVQKQSAASFISKAIQKYKQELCLIAFGPLTNFAMAFHLNQCS